MHYPMCSSEICISPCSCDSGLWLVAEPFIGSTNRGPLVYSYNSWRSTARSARIVSLQCTVQRQQWRCSAFPGGPPLAHLIGIDDLSLSKPTPSAIVLAPIGSTLHRYGQLRPRRPRGLPCPSSLSPVSCQDPRGNLTSPLCKLPGAFHT